MGRNPTLLISSSTEWDIQQPESCRLHIPNREGAVSDCFQEPPRRGRREAKTLYCNLSSQRNLWQHSPLIAVIPAHSSSDGKESACNAIPGLGRSPWVGSPPVFLPGEFHGQRSLVGYSPWGRKELDTTEQLTLPMATTVPAGSKYLSESLSHKFWFVL